MSQESVEVVRRILDRWATGDFRAGADELDPEVVFIVRPPFPEPAEVVGPAGITDYMRGFLKQWTGFTVEATGWPAQPQDRGGAARPSRCGPGHRRP